MIVMQKKKKNKHIIILFYLLSSISSMRFVLYTSNPNYFPLFISFMSLILSTFGDGFVRIYYNTYN